MLPKRFIKHSITAHIFSLVLLLVLGPVQSGWCFEGDNEIFIPDTVISDCHSIPTVCLSTTTVPNRHGGGNNPFECSECIDLTFEDLASSSVKSRNGDIDFSPALSFLQPQSVTSFDSEAFRPPALHVERSYKKDCTIHHSIKSTVLII